MVKKSSPTHGSLQFWPRVRSKDHLARVRSWTKNKDAKPVGFMGYKVGMAHYYGSEQEGKKTIFHSVPVTIIECPPLKILSVRFYNNNKLVTEVLCPNLDKELSRTIKLPKNSLKKLDDVKENFTDIRLNVYSQPKSTTIGKKKPDVFELPVGGNKDDQLSWVKDNLEKEINVKDIFEEQSLIDTHSVTTGKGFQGVIKRFGVRLKSHKSEKGQRAVGARSGGWTSHAHMMWRVPQPGKMGYHTRTDYNKVIMKIDDNLETINPINGFRAYGLVKNPYIIIKGSVSGPVKRAIKLSFPTRPNKKLLKSKIKFEKVIL